VKRLTLIVDWGITKFLTGLVLPVIEKLYLISPNWYKLKMEFEGYDSDFESFHSHEAGRGGDDPVVSNTSGSYQGLSSHSSGCAVGWIEKEKSNLANLFPCAWMTEVDISCAIERKGFLWWGL
jgi:hypothetical protein